MNEEIEQILKDKYTPAELIEEINISMDDLLYYLKEYIDDTELIQEHYEELYGEEE